MGALLTFFTALLCLFSGTPCPAEVELTRSRDRVGGHRSAADIRDHDHPDARRVCEDVHPAGGEGGGQGRGGGGGEEEERRRSGEERRGEERGKRGGGGGVEWRIRRKRTRRKVRGVGIAIEGGGEQRE
eukprot:758947-Hanusia_phi.AAC.1